MAGDAPIAWLASFPKSGNTWLRLLLANFLSNSEQPWTSTRTDCRKFFQCTMLKPKN